MFLNLNEMTHHVQLSGDRSKPAVLLLHSLGTSHALWQSQVERLSRTHFVIAPDFRGHGLSQESPSHYTCEDLAKDALALLEILNIKVLAIAGISMGGVVAQIIAAKLGPNITGLAIFDSYVKAAKPQMWKDRAAKVEADGLRSIADGVRAVWMTVADAQTPEGMGMIRMIDLCTDEGYAKACLALEKADCSSVTPSITCPTVVAFGSEDKAAPKADAEKLAGLIAGATVFVIEGAGHLPLLTHSDTCLNIIETVL